MKRPFGVTVLAVLAAIIGVISVLRVVQLLGILPINLYIGPFKFSADVFNLWGALMYGLLAWVYFWLVNMLWKVDPSAWLFLAVITVFNLIFGFLAMVGNNYQSMDLTMLLNAIILIYVMLPGVKKSFGMAK